MADPLVIECQSEPEAEAVRKKRLRLRQAYPIALGDAVVAVKQDDGSPKLNRLFSSRSRRVPSRARPGPRSSASCS